MKKSPFFDEDAETAEVRKAIKTPKKAEAKRKMLSSGNTLLNLACAGKVFGCFKEGGFYLVIGDSESGKTALAGTCFAEACITDYFDDHDLVFDNVENGALMFESWFGPKIAARIKRPPLGNSDTAEKFYANVHKCTNNPAKKKGIYVLDSEPALTSEQEKAKQAEIRIAIEKDKLAEQSGVMTDGKAAIHSRNMRTMHADLVESGWIVIMITQTRDNMGFGAQFNPKTRPGGKALKFFAQFEMWSSVKTKIKKRVRGKEREIGIISVVQVKKNRLNGKHRTVELPIYNDFGFDDLGGCIDWLLMERHWKAIAGEIPAKEFGFKGTREELIRHLEEKGIEDDLRRLVGEVWHSIEAELKVERKSRYA